MMDSVFFVCVCVCVHCASHTHGTPSPHGTPAHTQPPPPSSSLKFLTGGSKSTEPAVSEASRASQLSERRQTSLLGRCRTIKASSSVLTPAGFRSRISYLTDPSTGALHMKTEKKDMAEMFMQNPDAMGGMMKQQLGSLGPQLALGAFVNTFFKGFVLGKLPFALSPKFRGMLQSGIDLPSLDVSYLSSLSYYMLLLFGSRGILTLFFKDVVNDAAMAQQLQGRGMASPMMGMGGQDVGKQLEAEAKAMDLLQHRFRGDDVEARAADVLLKRRRRATL